MATLAVLIVSILRQKTPYFKTAQILLTVAFSASALVVFCDMTKNYLINELWIAPYASVIGLSAVFITAITVEHAALTLYYPSRKSFFSGKLPILSYVYKGYIISVLILTWVFTPWQTQEVPNLFGGTVYIPVYEGWYLTALLVTFLIFIAYPCTLFILSGQKRTEKSASDALTWLGACWMSVGSTLIIFNGLIRHFGFETVEAGYLLNGFYFAVIAYCFKKVTVLEEFFDTLRRSPLISEGEHLVLFYSSKIDKMSIFSPYVQKGLLRGDKVVYVYPDEEADTVRTKLKECGIDVEKHENKGSLLLMSLSEAYVPNDVLDEEGLIQFWAWLKADTKKRGYKHERDLFDLGDLSFLRTEEEKERYFAYLKEASEQLMDPFLIELRAVDAENLSENLLQKFKFLSTKSMDLLEHLDQFSRVLGRTHQEIVGENILCEFDPASDYENIVKDFITESLANTEPTVVFTRKGSSLHLDLRNKKNVRLFILTLGISVPQADVSENEILLPANNTSLLLDTLSRTLEAYPYSNFSVVFSNLSELIFSIGFKETYNFLRYALEILAAKNATALFLFNPSAHSPAVVSSLKSLFNNQIKYNEKGLETVKLSESFVEMQMEVPQ
ncbi:MAG: MEDS domain-containing protein [Thermoproteota archaeon]|nr:MEDS domain-containing protein [Thermoproteota archaeon]